MARSGISLFLLACCLSTALSAQVLRSVTISLFATDLSKCDSLSKCDAFVELVCVTSQTAGRECGKTAVRKNDNFPVWEENFTFSNSSEEQLQSWEFTVKDQDVGFNDLIAQVSVSLPDFLAGTNTQRNYRLSLGERGALYISRLNVEMEDE